MVVEDGETLGFGGEGEGVLLHPLDLPLTQSLGTECPSDEQSMLRLLLAAWMLLLAFLDANLPRGRFKRRTINHAGSSICLASGCARYLPSDGSKSRPPSPPTLQHPQTEGAMTLNPRRLRSFPRLPTHHPCHLARHPLPPPPVPSLAVYILLPTVTSSNRLNLKKCDWRSGQRVRSKTRKGSLSPAASGHYILYSEDRLEGRGPYPSIGCRELDRRLVAKGPGFESRIAQFFFHLFGTFYCVSRWILGAWMDGSL